MMRPGQSGEPESSRPKYFVSRTLCLSSLKNVFYRQFFPNAAPGSTFRKKGGKGVSSKTPMGAGPADALRPSYPEPDAPPVVVVQSHDILYTSFRDILYTPARA